MRKLIVCNIMSLDGYYEGPGRNVMVMPMDSSFDAYNAERLRAADTLLVGRSTYDIFRSFWPTVAGNAAFTPVQWEISRLDEAIEKVVISDSITADETAPWTDTTRIVRRANTYEQVADLKRGEGREILVFGSRTLWNDLLGAGLVDELHLMVGPLILGGGTPAFDAGKVPPLRLIGTRTFDDSANVVLQYEAAR